MKITEFAEYIWSDKQSRYLLIRDKSINWTESVAYCKGASAQQTNLANSQTAFYNTMTQDYNTQFANQNAILGTLTQSLSPIIAAGPNQMGYNNAELTNLNSQALQGTGQSYANASQALKENQAASGGGNSYLPSGVQSQQQAGLASAAANQESNQMLGIQQAGYQQGNSMYESAIGQLGGVAGMYNANGTASSANSAGGQADTEANAVNTSNQQFSNDIMGLATGGLGAAGSALSGALGKGGALGCWIAAELFGGWEDSRTIAVRTWLDKEFSKRWYGRLFLRWYSRYGENMSKRVHNNQAARRAFLRLFEWFLEQATKAEEGVCP
jgi:hypothetical protein